MYHYCDAAGFKGILESKTLWATDYRFLNDSAEVLASKKQLETGKQLIVDELPKAEHRERVGRLIDRATVEEFDLFIASFSKGGNKLSQWRSYADEGRGYSIGFCPDTLKDNGLEVAPVTYGADFLDPLISAIVGFCDNAFISERERERAIYRSIIQAIALNKMDAFYEEEEIRLTVFTHTATAQEIRYRASHGRIVPYVSIDLAAAWPSLVRSVWVGPSQDNPHNKAVIREFLNSIGLTQTEVNGSNTSFRRV